MIPRICSRLFLALALGALTPSLLLGFQPQERFLAMVSDGARLKSAKIVNWFDLKSKPTLANHPVFDANRPIRWIVDQAVQPSPDPKAMLEFFGGDRLPARVIGYVRTAPNSFENLGECLIVKPTCSIDLPSKPRSPYIRVSTQWLKRIVFDEHPGPPPRYRPGTLFLKNGGQLDYKSVRWGKGTLSILTSEGSQSFSWQQIAELHLPLRDMWEVWFDQLCALDPNLNQRLFQIDSATGVRLTVSRQRLRPLYHGDRNKSDNWYPEFQPAWSLDPLVLPFKTIGRWRFFSAIEPPATMFEPAAKREKAHFSSDWNWQRNQNAQRQNLISNALHFGWGFGVHAPTELSLPLHRVVTHFRVRAGLDQSVMTGGCARGIVLITSKTPAELQRTGIMIGNRSLHDTNWLAVSVPDHGQSALVLRADPVISDRPANADPFDLRDRLNWLEPEWRLDRIKLQQLVSRRVRKIVPSLAGWTLHNRLHPETPKPNRADQPDIESNASTKPIVAAVPYRDETIAESTRTRIAIRPTERFVVVKRTYKVGRKARWFAVAVSRTKGSTPGWLQVRADGRVIGQGEIAERRARTDPEPVVIPIAHLAGKVAVFEIVMIVEGAQSNLDFRGARVLRDRPGLVRLFEDEPDFAKKIREGKGELSVTNKMAYTKFESLRLTDGDRVQAQIDGYDYPITETPRLGEYRYLRFAWKKEGGQRIGLQIGFNGELGSPAVADNNRAFAVARQQTESERARERARRRGPRERFIDDGRGMRFGYQYDTGNGTPQKPVMRLSNKPPTNWAVYTRDLFGEFGSFHLTGLGFLCPDGSAAYFDNIYLARTQNDFRYTSDGDSTPRIADKNVLVNATRPWEHQLAVQRVAPEFSLVGSGEPVQLLASHLGKKNVVRTAPMGPGKPAILRAPLSVPSEKKTFLKIVAGRNLEAMADWQLVVKVGTEQLHQSMLNADTAKEGWAEFSLDLSKFAGQNIVLEVHNHPNNWHYEHAYWSKVAFETE